MAPARKASRVAERTSPEVAIERLALWLNLQKGEEVTLNQLAKQCGVAWGTASKYLALIQRLQNILPKCERTPLGVRVTATAGPMQDLLSDPAVRSALALMLRQQEDETILEDTLPVGLEEGLDALIEMGCATHESGKWELTPPGWALANEAYLEATEGPPSTKEDTKVTYVKDFDGFPRPTTKSVPRSDRGEFHRLPGETMPAAA